MSKKNKNPYRKGSAYNAIFADWQKKQVITEQELVAAGHKLDDVRVVLSPRESSKRGDCRGNASSAGHLYFAEQLKRNKVDGVKENQRERLRWRPVALEPRKRGEKVSVEAQKVASTATPVTAEAPATQATAKAKDKSKVKA